MNHLPPRHQAATAEESGVRPQPRRRSARRVSGVAAVAAGAAVVSLLSACGSSSSSSASASASGSSSASAAAASTGSAGTATTRSVSTAKGQVTIPAHPLRVVSVHSFTTESLFDLGVTPIGVEDSGEQYEPPRYLARWKAVDKVATGATINYEKIAELKPDLIVGVDVPYLDADYKKLSAIAPTVLAPFDQTGNWSSYPAATADYVGRDTQLAALKQQYDDKIAAAKETYGAELAKEKWDVVQGGFDSGNYWIYGEQSPVGKILAALGTGFGSATQAVKGGGTDSVSYEKTELLKDADHIIYYTNNDGSPANHISKLFALQTFKELPAAKADAVVGTADFLPGSYSDAMGVIDSVTQALAKQH